MPKKSELLKQICEELNGLDQISDLSVLKELRNQFSFLEDSRHPSYTEHKLEDIVMITLLGVLADANEWYKIEVFARKKLDWLSQILELPNGVPSHDTIQRVMARIKPDALHNICVQFLIEKMDRIQKLAQQQNPAIPTEIEIISIDGKASTGSARKADRTNPVKALQTVSAYSSAYDLSLAQKYIDEKSNEIPVTPEIISLLNVKDTIVTWDALNTQKETVKAVIRGQGDYVAALKENQKLLYEDVKDYFDEEQKKHLRTTPEKYKKTIEKAHSCVETREYYMENEIVWLEDAKKWKGLQSIGMVEKTILRADGRKTVETRYYIMSLRNDVEEFSRAVRTHWQVENNLHWQLDFTMREDSNTTMEKNSLKSFGVIKRIALAILRLVQETYKMSLPKIRYSLSLDFEEEIGRIFSLLNVEKIESMVK